MKTAVKQKPKPKPKPKAKKAVTKKKVTAKKKVVSSGNKKLDNSLKTLLKSKSK